MTPSEQLKLLIGGTETVVTEADLAKKLDQSFSEKRPLRIKLGCDPTAPDLHLGHSVALSKLRQFQDCGHLAVLIIGDYTAMIGDPTGRNTMRPPLSQEQIVQNAKTYQQQVFKVLHPDQTELCYNSQWFDRMTASEMIQLSSHMSAAQMLQRRDFKERFQNNVDISLSEFLYPLLQGWDSVVIRADVELGGTDQLFNMLVGRDLQHDEKQDQQVVMTLPLLEGLDGSEKMSKSKGNYIGLSETPQDIYGKAMSVSDDLMWRWWQLLYGKTASEISLMKQGHPMDAKRQLAFSLVDRFHGRPDAEMAAAHFAKQFSKRDLAEVAQPLPVSGAEMSLIELIEAAQQLSGEKTSRADIRRLLQQGGVQLDGQKLTDPNARLSPGDGQILKVGKRLVVRLTLKW